MPALPRKTRAEKRIPGIPLFLVPKVIQEQIRVKGAAVFSIVVERRLHHRYRVRVETFPERETRRLFEEHPGREPTIQVVLDV